MIRLLLTLAALCLLSTNAEARSHHHKHHHHHRHHHLAARPVQPSLLNLFQTSADRIMRPSRYIAGRLICAVNVGSALAERGIKGTGSALALSYLRWGRSAGGPIPGAVAVSARRGGGHVAIVSQVLPSGVVMVWNPSPHGHGWQEVAYRHHAIDYRVPG